MASEQPDVVVVGGGIAGIIVALGASQRGLKVTMIESGPRLAGRARSWKDPHTKDPIPIGPHIFLDSYPACFKLLGELGTADKVVWQKDPNLFMTWVEGQKETDISYGSLPAPASLSPGLLNMIRDFPEIEQADIQSVVAVTIYAFSLSEPQMLELDNETTTSFLRRWNVTERMINRFFSFVAHAIFNVPIEELSACAMVRFYKVLCGTSSMKIGFPNCGLGDLYTPAEGILKAIGCDVRLRTKAVALLGSDTRCDGVELESGELLRPSVGVVMTLPAYTMASLLRKEWLASPAILAATQMQPCAYMAIYFWFDKKLTTKDFWSRTFQEESLTCDWYDFSNIYEGWQGKPSFIGVNMIDTSMRSVGKWTDEQVLDGAFKELCEYLPAARDANILHTQVTRVPCAIHRPVVGSERARLPPGRCASVEKLFFAGDWTATELPYCMESASNSGWTCAESVVDAAMAEGIKTKGSAGLRVAPPDITLAAKMIGKLDIFRPLSLWLTNLRIGATRREENLRARL